MGSNLHDTRGGKGRNSGQRLHFKMMAPLGIYGAVGAQAYALRRRRARGVMAHVVSSHRARRRKRRRPGRALVCWGASLPGSARFGRTVSLPSGTLIWTICATPRRGASSATRVSCLRRPRPCLPRDHLGVALPGTVVRPPPACDASLVTPSVQFTCKSHCFTLY